MIIKILEKKLKFSLFFFPLVLLMCCNPAPDKNSNEKLEIEAYNASQSGHYLSSLSYYNKLIKNDSLNGRYYFGRADSYLMLLKKDEATRDYLKSAKLSYKNGSCYFNIGLLNNFVNDSVALIYFREALKIYPNRSDFQKEYDECLRRIKKDSIN